MDAKIDWNHVAENLGSRLFLYFKRKGANQEASDLTQEALIRLYDKVTSGSFQIEKGSLSQFAFGIARLIWLEHQKDWQDFAPLNLENLNMLASNQNQEGYLDHRDQHCRMKQVLVCLSSIQQEIVTLVADQNLKMREIAEILQLPEGTVKSHFHRAKETLKNKLNLQEIV